ncbi:MAG: hypothetical protein COA79_11455 [Planctomycetota bacterium]|nr:MAG: hypothetical protein COA79_11455 [Planctomycetota bacterium]
MKRIFDIVLAVSFFFILAPLMLIVAALVKFTSRGPTIYWSDRVGQFNKLFKMPKFRTMLVDTPVLATHLMNDPDSYLTPIGSFLRKSSLDEIPQLWNIFKGDMSFVGPRPALYNQDDLIALRTENGVDKIKPGLTGWAQVNGRDELPLEMKVKYDVEYLARKNILFDIRVMFLTALKVVTKSNVAH